MRFFRADEQTYEDARAAIDAALGWPDEGTATSIEPASTAPRDPDGRVLLAAEDWLSDRPELLRMTEIEESDYRNAINGGS